jgi:xanthine dehydrogenase/oxidase
MIEDIFQWDQSITLYVNGKEKHVATPDPTMTLLTYLRGEGLTGTKLGCGEGK